MPQAPLDEIVLETLCPPIHRVLVSLWLASDIRVSLRESLGLTFRRRRDPIAHRRCDVLVPGYILLGYMGRMVEPTLPETAWRESALVQH